MAPLISTIFLIALAHAHDNTYWAGIDNKVTISPPLAQPLPNSIDTQTTIYPAINSFGSIYVPYGSIVLDYGDIVLNNKLSILQQINYINTIAARLCGISMCSSNMYINVSSCLCQCLPGFTGVLCNRRICANGGVWAGSACSCIGPYTPASMCTEYDCPQNALFNPSTSTCDCVPGYTGLDCETLILQPQSQVACIDPYATQCRQKKNWGVAQCTNGLCTCFPLYDMTSNTFVQRWAICGASTTCVQWFHTLAPYCCLGIVACERIQHSLQYCTTEACCDSLRGEECIARGCSFSTNACILQLPQWQIDPSIVFFRRATSCLSSPNHPLCNNAVASLQVSIRRSSQTPYTDIQSLAYTQISQYDIWDDNIPHSIILYTPTYNNPDIIACETTWRLSINVDSPAWSMFTWACGHTLASQTSFSFSIVERSGPYSQYIEPAMIGSIYRIWVYNTQWCLIDRTLQPDEITYFGITTPYQNDLIAINIADQSITASIDDCGVFIVQDNTIYTLLNAQMLSQNPNDPSKPTLAPLSATLQTVTTPSSSRDSDQIPQPIIDDLALCRHLPCLIPTVRATCSSITCATTTLNISTACVPCIYAHVVLV